MTGLMPRGPQSGLEDRLRWLCRERDYAFAQIAFLESRREDADARSFLPDAFLSLDRIESRIREVREVLA